MSEAISKPHPPRGSMGAFAETPVAAHTATLVRAGIISREAVTDRALHAFPPAPPKPQPHLHYETPKIA
jgi:hypothetical protein